MNFAYSKLFSLLLIVFGLQLWSLPSLAADVQEAQRLERRINDLERALREEVRDHEERLRVLTERIDRIAPIVQRLEDRIDELYRRPPSGVLQVPPARRAPSRGNIMN